MPRDDVTTLIGADVQINGVRALLCDADGTLFPSEEPAFAASALVMQALAARYGLTGDFSAEQLRRSTTGKNFRATANSLLEAAGREVRSDELDRWVAMEKHDVTAHLAHTLTVRHDVVDAVRQLSERFRLAVVSASATTRLAACFTSSGLDRFFPAPFRFSAEDDLPCPVSKPDPAIYRYALAQLQICAAEALAIEDSRAGVESAVGADIATIGFVQFVPVVERRQRIDQLRAAGAVTVAESWPALTAMLSRDERRATGHRGAVSAATSLLP